MRIMPEQYPQILEQMGFGSITNINIAPNTTTTTTTSTTQLSTSVVDDSTSSSTLTSQSSTSESSNSDASGEQKKGKYKKRKLNLQGFARPIYLCIRGDTNGKDITTIFEETRDNPPPAMY